MDDLLIKILREIEPVRKWTSICYECSLKFLIFLWEPWNRLCSFMCLQCQIKVKLIKSPTSDPGTKPTYPDTGLIHVSLKCKSYP